MYSLHVQYSTSHDFADLRGRHGSCTLPFRMGLLTPVGVGKPWLPSNSKPSSAESG
jgi:hypothetical protein